jgi:hypothetical protein
MGGDGQKESEGCGEIEKGTHERPFIVEVAGAATFAGMSRVVDLFDVYREKVTQNSIGDIEKCNYLPYSTKVL